MSNPDDSVPPVEVETHYYAGTTNFEQSLDVYSPSAPSNLPLVVIVVGSAWTGHRAFIYRFCSWWNSSAPAAIAHTGCVCVCIRHRGAFVRPPPLWILVVVIELLIICAAQLETIVVTALLMIALLGLALFPLSRGAATYDDMLDDVSRALAWVRTNRDRLVAPSQRLVFGGYSSGAHVASTLLTRPDVLAARGVPAPKQWCDGVILLSGVLGVRPGAPLSTSASWAAGLPGLIVRNVFGKEAAASLPSPVHMISQQLPLPHLLIYCEHEVFNLQPIERAMGVMFCSEMYGAALKARGVDALMLPVQSDHWAVLNSKGFASALHTAFRERRWP